MLRCDLPRLRREPTRLSDGRRVSGAPALDQRERSRDHRHHERRRDDREQGAQAAGSAPRCGELTLLGLQARFEELALDLGERPLAPAARAPRRGEPRGTDQLRCGHPRPRSEPRSSVGGVCAARPDPPPASRVGAATRGSAPRARSRPSPRRPPGAGSPPAAPAPLQPLRSRSSGISSASDTRLRVSSVDSPSSVSWSSIRRMIACSCGLQLSKTSSAVCAIAPRTPPAAR